MNGDEPSRPWLIHAGGELFGDFRTREERDKAIPEATATGEEVTTSRWDREGHLGPGWTDPQPLEREAGE